MKKIHTALISLTLAMAAASNTFAATTNSDKTIRADFKNKILLIPCVEVTNSPFDGFYNVLMQISGNGSGLDWKVKEAKKVTEDDCDGAPDSASTDDLLKTLGLPSLADLIKDDPKDDTPPPANTSAINDAITNNIVNNISNGVKQ